MNSGINLAVVLRKRQQGVSIADEHDCERITAYCRELGGQYGVALQVIVPEDRGALENIERWDGFLFVGADDFARQFIERLDARRPVFLWAKGYDLTIDPRWAPALARVQLFFNSSYLSSVEDRYHERTQYLPTAFHDRWPWSIAGWVDDLRNRLFDVQRFDLVFSGSDRHVRSDRYRQRLLNLLVRRGLKVCVAAPRAVWNRPHQDWQSNAAELDPSIRILGNWGTERTFRQARCLLDLPWLDNVFEAHPRHHDPNRSIFALGWNIFRAGAYGACMLTYDCAANRALGLSEDHCLFYTSDISNLDALADEIVERAAACRDKACDDKRSNVRRLFHERHTYRERWQHICREISRCYREQGAAQCVNL